jgi:hypothetical protein
MTPKEKAEELINRFITEGCLFANAKKCALIAVDEILYSKPTQLDNDTIDFFRNTETIRFYKQVKTEIEKL